MEKSLTHYRSQVNDIIRWEGFAHWEFHSETSVFDVSPEFIVAFGFADDVLPITIDRWKDLMHPDDVLPTLSSFETLVTGQTDVLDIIYRIKIPSGAWRYLRSRGGIAESFHEGKKAVRISGSIQDVTDIRSAEIAHQHMVRLLAAGNSASQILLTTTTDDFEMSVIEVLHILGVATEVDRVYIWQNEWVDGELGCTQIYEWSPVSAPQQGNDLTVRIKYRESIPGWEKCLTAGECVNNIVRNMSQAEQDQLSPQGIISILVAPIMFQNEFWGFIGFDDCQRERIWSEIEANILKSMGMLIASAIRRQRAELDLIKERQTLDWVLETSPIAAITAKNGKISHMNKRGTELFDFSEESSVLAIGRTILGEHKNTFGQGLVIKEIREKGKFTRRGIQFMCVDGVKRDFLLTTVPFQPNDFQKLISWVVDITELKETERALVQERDKAEIATKAKSDFLARMSHEIRTPMNAILGMVYLCLQTQLTEKQRDYLTKTQAAANGLLGIINDVLDFSKIEAGKVELEVIPFSLQQMIDEVAGIMGMNAAEKGLKLVTKTDPDTPDRLIGDPLRLRQILFNLTSNAIKFTTKGGIFITVRQDDLDFQRDFQGGANRVSIAFEVRDTGIGLKPEQLDTIFESFSQADGSTTRKYGGTGLGLAIVKSLVELMGGKIFVTSVHGQGATFAFTIVFTVSQSEPGQFSSAVLLNQRRVLLVDDDANDLEIMTNLMQSMHMNVEFVRSGAAALEKLREATQFRIPFELVVIDWRMPRMDGAEVIRTIRQSEDIYPPHILMISAYDRHECLHHVQGLNVADVLVKPVQPEVFKEAMKAAFRGDLSRGTSEKRADLRGAKILLAEDNKINQIVASELLTMLKVEVTVVNNGIEAIEAVKKHDFDLILMDIQMPDMDGLEATHIIRNLNRPGTDKLPILAMTANAMDTDYKKSLDVGMNDHLTKPIDPDKLRIALEKWLGR